MRASINQGKTRQSRQAPIKKRHLGYGEATRKDKSTCDDQSLCFHLLLKVHRCVPVRGGEPTIFFKLFKNKLPASSIPRHLPQPAVIS